MQQGGEEARKFWGLSEHVIGACIEVHRALGPGLLESTYEQCLGHELALRGLPFERQVNIPVTYKCIRLDYGYRLDLLIANTLVVEVKAVDQLTAVHEAQLLTYLKLTKLPVGILVNFHTATLRSGIRRMQLA